MAARRLILRLPVAVACSFFVWFYLSNRCRPIAIGRQRGNVNVAQVRLDAAAACVPTHTGRCRPIAIRWQRGNVSVAQVRLVAAAAYVPTHTGRIPDSRHETQKGAIQTDVVFSSSLFKGWVGGIFGAGKLAAADMYDDRQPPFFKGGSKAGSRFHISLDRTRHKVSLCA